MKINNKVERVLAQHYSFFMASSALVWQIFFCLIPLAVIVITSFFPASVADGIFSYYYAIIDHAHIKLIWWSVLLALCTTISCLILAYPLAYWLARHVKRYKNFFIFFLIVPFWTNLLVLVYSWIFILERHGLINRMIEQTGIIREPFAFLNNMVAVTLVMVYCYLPFMVLPIFNVLEKIEPTIIEASSDLGAGFWQTLFYIILPLSWSGVRTGIFLVFVPAFGELVIPLLIGGEKYMVVGNTISHYVFTVLDMPKAAALTVIAGFVLFISIGIVNWLLKKIIFGRS